MSQGGVKEESRRSHLEPDRVQRRIHRACGRHDARVHVDGEEARAAQQHVRQPAELARVGIRGVPRRQADLDGRAFLDKFAREVAVAEQDRGVVVDVPKDVNWS